MSRVQRRALRLERPNDVSLPWRGTLEALERSVKVQPEPKCNQWALLGARRMVRVLEWHDPAAVDKLLAVSLVHPAAAAWAPSEKKRPLVSRSPGVGARVKSQV